MAGTKIGVRAVFTENVHFLNPFVGERYINLEVSPDGTKLVFEVVGGHFYIMNTDGSGLKDLGIGYRPQWSPNSQYLVYMVTEDDGHRYSKSDLYIIKTDGTEKTRLTRTENIIEMNPTWSPDGDKIAYDVLGEGAIYRVQIAQ